MTYLRKDGSKFQLGSRDQLAIEICPLAPTWSPRHLPERTGWAQFAIWANGHNLCRNLLDGESSSREYVNVPLGDIADWLVQSWTSIRFEERPDRFPPRASAFDTLRDWGDTNPPESYDEEKWFDLRECWWQGHFLASGANGSQLPNLSLFRGGDRLFVEWNRAEFAGSPAPNFLSEFGQASVRWDEGEAVFAEFVAYVAECFQKENLSSVFSWTDLKDPLREIEVDFQKRLRAFTGMDADALYTWTGAENERELRRRLDIPADSDDPSESVKTQVLKDLPPTTPDSVRDGIWQLDELIQGAANNSEGLDALRTTARDAVEVCAAPEETGQLAAREVRKHLGLNGWPFRDIHQHMHDFGVEVREGVDCMSERMLVGSRCGVGAGAIINKTPSTRTPWGKRFEMARALGHLLVDSYRADALGAASTTYAQPWARRCSGAFAAELLLPSEHLSERFKKLDSAANREFFLSLLNEYGVGARTAAYQLWNHGLLSSPQVRDELIDEFSNSAQ